MSKVETGDDSAGVRVEYVKSRRYIYLGGWFDHIAGIQSEGMSLGEFLRRLGVTLKDCERELK